MIRSRTRQPLGCSVGAGALGQGEEVVSELLIALLRDVLLFRHTIDQSGGEFTHFHVVFLRLPAQQ